MANSSQRRSMRRAAAGAGANVASVLGANLKGAAAIAQAAAVTPRRQKPALSTKSSRRLFDVLSASAANKGRLLAEMFKDVSLRLGAVIKKHNMKGLAKYFGFPGDKDFVKHLRARVAVMEQRDPTFSEFHEGALGRQNAFIGILFEMTVKYGPVRRFIEDIAWGTHQSINRDITAARRAGRAHTMHDATGAEVDVHSPFSEPLTAFAFDIETNKGTKESLDFGPAAFNADGQWCIPLPVEIKLPRAAGGVAGQFEEFPKRIAAAAKKKQKVIGYFASSDAARLKKLVAKGAGNVLGEEIIDGRKMVKVELEPGKLVFNSTDDYGPMSRNQMVTQPDIDVWNPAVPNAVPSPKSSEKVVIGKISSQPVSLDVAVTQRGNGFNYWRLLVPVKRELFIDLYAAVFNVDP